MTTITELVDIIAELQNHNTRSYDYGRVKGFCKNVKLHYTFSDSEIKNAIKELNYFNLNPIYNDLIDKFLEKEKHNENEFFYRVQSIMYDNMKESDCYKFLNSGDELLDFEWDLYGRSGGWLILTEFEGISGDTMETLKEIEIPKRSTNRKNKAHIPVFSSFIEDMIELDIIHGNYSTTQEIAGKLIDCYENIELDESKVDSLEKLIKFLNQYFSDKYSVKNDYLLTIAMIISSDIMDQYDELRENPRTPGFNYLLDVV